MHSFSARYVEPLLDDMVCWQRDSLEKLSRKSEMAAAHPVRPEPMAGAAALLQRWTDRDR